MMTYNIHHGSGNLNAISEFINSEKPDIVALQEVDVNTRRSGFTLNQAQVLATQTGMNVFFSKSINYQGGEFGNAILSRFSITKGIRYELPTIAGNPTEKRSLAVIEIVTKDEQKIYFASTHLDHSHPATRQLQIGKIREITADLNDTFIIGGDFNAIPGSVAINRFIEGDFFKKGCIDNNCQYTVPAKNPVRTIDYIFLNQKAQADFTVLSYATLNEILLSDHLPVITQLVYK